MADVVIVVRKSLLSHPNVSPRAAAAGAIVLAVQRQSRRQRKGQRLPGSTRVDLRVHVECKSGHLVGRCTAYPGDAVIFLGVDRRDGEGVFKEDGVGHDYAVTK